jgi:hypothetical protein
LQASWNLFTGLSTPPAETQAAFDYQAGRDVGERPPLSEFREHEFADTAGLHWRKEA